MSGSSQEYANTDLSDGSEQASECKSTGSVHSTDYERLNAMNNKREAELNIEAKRERKEIPTLRNIPKSKSSDASFPADSKVEQCNAKSEDSELRNVIKVLGGPHEGKTSSYIHDEKHPLIRDEPPRLANNRIIFDNMAAAVTETENNGQRIITEVENEFICWRSQPINAAEKPDTPIESTLATTPDAKTAERPRKHWKNKLKVHIPPRDNSHKSGMRSLSASEEKKLEGAMQLAATFSDLGARDQPSPSPRSPASFFSSMSESPRVQTFFSLLKKTPKPEKKGFTDELNMSGELTITPAAQEVYDTLVEKSRSSSNKSTAPPVRLKYDDSHETGVAENRVDSQSDISLPEKKYPRSRLSLKSSTMQRPPNYPYRRNLFRQDGSGVSFESNGIANCERRYPIRSGERSISVSGDFCSNEVNVVELPEPRSRAPSIPSRTKSVSDANNNFEESLEYEETLWNSISGGSNITLSNAPDTPPVLPPPPVPPRVPLRPSTVNAPPRQRKYKLSRSSMGCETHLQKENSHPNVPRRQNRHDLRIQSETTYDYPKGNSRLRHNSATPMLSDDDLTSLNSTAESDDSVFLNNEDDTSNDSSTLSGSSKTRVCLKSSAGPTKWNARALGLYDQSDQFWTQKVDFVGNGLEESTSELSENITYEDLLEFALDQPSLTLGNDCTTQKIELIRKSLNSPSVSEEECYSALMDTNNDVQNAIKLIKLRNLLRTNLGDINTCKEALLKCNWNNEAATNYLIRQNASDYAYQMLVRS